MAKPPNTPAEAALPKGGPLTALRNWFFAGLVVAAPLGITLWLVWSFVVFVDGAITPLLPRAWDPENWLGFQLPGLGIIIVVVGLTLLGAIVANLFGRTMVRVGELILARVPLVRSIYSVIKQVVETLASNDASSFKEAVLVEYPGKGLWVLGFVTSRNPDPEIAAGLPELVGVLIPSSPNPAMGQLVFVTPERIRRLEMSVEKAAKLVISFGIRSADPSETPDADKKS
jgi:uncharacterized membrane protein